jgi:dihydrofolate synthase / folylpolyglutamate synthase
MITTYKQAQDFLDSFINYEKISDYSYTNSFKSRRMAILAKAAGINIGKLKVLHIAGTKGKGSTAWMSAFMLTGCGHKVGVYTSPHLYDFRERIQITSRRQGTGSNRKIDIRQRLIPKKEVVEIAGKIARAVKNVSLPKKYGAFSFFEVYTAVAFIYFLKERVDYAVIETGLGGRLDATNIVKPLLSVITRIGYDHTALLGTTLEAIAGEKAGIIKENTPVVVASAAASVLAVIKRIASKKHAPLMVCGGSFGWRRLSLGRCRINFDFYSGERVIKNVSLSLKGAYQVENAACALAALTVLGNKCLLKSDDFHKALPYCFIPGRFEKISQSPLIIIDIAHNETSFAALRGSLNDYYRGFKVILIFGCSQDKDHQAMLAIMPSELLILTRSSNPRARDPRIIAGDCRRQEVVVAKNVGEALREALSRYRKRTVIVVSGSLYLAAEARKAYNRFQRKKGGFFSDLK